MQDIQRMQTNMSSEWIDKIVANNPSRLLESGNVILPPARMAFGNIVTPAKDSAGTNGEVIKGKYGATLLFPAGADLTALRDARKAMLRTAFPKNPDGLGLSDPIKDQADKVAPAEGGMNKLGKTLSGYVPGNHYIAPGANLDYKPQLNVFVGGKVQPAYGTPDELNAIFYSGAWVIATVSVFHGKNPQNPNIFFGLSSILKVADDQRFSGGGGDGPDAFAGVQIDADVDPASLFS